MLQELFRDFTVQTPQEMFGVEDEKKILNVYVYKPCLIVFGVWSNENNYEHTHL